MRSMFKVLAVTAASVVVAKKGGAKKEKFEAPPVVEAADNGPLLTIGSTVSFVGSSLTLGKDLSSYVVSTGFNAAYDLVPPPQQKQAEKFYYDTYAQVDKLRTQNKIPTFTELYDKAWDLYESKLSPVVTKATTTARNVLFPVEKILNSVVAQFESAYPTSKGLFPDDIFDQMFVLLWLLYGVLGYVVMPVLNCLCCGACSKRAEAPRKSNGKTNLTAAKASLKKRQ